MRLNSNPDPCSWLLPDLVMMFTTPPAARPTSAVYMLVWTLTSATASIDGLTPTVPIARSLLSMPSISWLFWLSSEPLIETAEL